MKKENTGESHAYRRTFYLPDHGCSQVSLPGKGTALPRATESLGHYLDPTQRATVDVIRETDELSKARLAWIMGRRGTVSQADEFLVQIGNELGPEFFRNGPGDRNTYWDAGKGVNRSSKLCSTEYLGRLFEVAMRRVCIQLSLRYDFEEMGGQPSGYGGNKNSGFFPNYSGGLLGTVSKPMKMEGMSSSKGVVPQHKDGVAKSQQALAMAVGATTDELRDRDRDAITELITRKPFPHITAAHPLQVPLQRSASMTLTNNITFDVASREMRENEGKTPASESLAVRSVDNREMNRDSGTFDQPLPDRDFKCGIYPRPLSPFLHGRTLMQGMSATLLDSEKGYPRRMPDALGDHVAFAALEQAMTRVGILDWRPDGVVNSKLENGPDEMVEPPQSTLET